MDALSLKHLISSVCGSFPRRWYLTSSSMHRIRQVPLQTRRAGMQNGRSRVTRWAKEFELRGSWRLGGVSLKVIDPHQSSIGSNEDGKQNQYDGLQYSFEASNILVGDGGDVSMVELRPALVTELEDDISTLLDVGLSKSTPLSDQKISPEESMREYTDLKLSLLLYDALLIFAGTLIAVSAANEKAAQGFLVGGAGGFLYLLLLQKSVDGLSTPALSTVKRENLKQVFGGFKGPLTSLALVFAFAIVIVKYGLGNASIVLTPQELLAGAAGFLTCKVAVILAAFKPMQTSLKENK